VDDSGGSGLPSGFFTANVTANEINVAGVLNVLGTVHADGSIVANTLSSTDVSASGIGSCIRVGSGGIQRFAVPGAFLSDLPHFISAPQVSSTGGINFDGEAGIGFGFGSRGAISCTEGVTGRSLTGASKVRSYFIGLAGAIAAILLAIYLPMFDMVNTIK
jgi:hypothetical protein